MAALNFPSSPTLNQTFTGNGNTWQWNGTSWFAATPLTSAAITTALGFAPYSNTNPNGYTSNTGTVTSVSGTGTVSGLTLSGAVTSSGSLTLSGTLAVTPSNFASQTANTFLSAPNGAAGVPTFRAIVAADIPTLNQNTTGTASNVTGTVAITNGGTGATSAATALSNLGAYPATNPNGYTSNTGTVTSVSGTGTVSGLTLSGTVTGSGSLTLGGTLSLSSSNVTDALGYTPLSTGGGTVSGPVTLSGGVNSSLLVKKENTTGEGGQILLERSDTSALTGNLTIDLFGSTLRIFDAGGTNKGISIDINACAAAAGSGLITDQGGTFLGAVTLQSAAPILNFFETDQTLPAGRRRFVQDGNTFSLRRNTAAAGNFSTEAYDINVDASGNFTALGNVTAYSDERLKTDWADLPADFVEQLSKVKSGTYTRIDSDIRQIGVSAQSLQTVAPEGVIGTNVLSVAYGNVALVAAVELAKRVTEQDARIARLEAAIAALK